MTREQVTALGLEVQNMEAQVRAEVAKYAGGNIPFEAERTIREMDSAVEAKKAEYRTASNQLTAEFTSTLSSLHAPNPAAPVNMIAPVTLTDTAMQFPKTGKLSSYPNTPEGREQAYMDGLFYLACPVLSGSDTLAGTVSWARERLKQRSVNNDRFKQYNVEGQAYQILENKMKMQQRSLGEAVNMQGGVLTPQLLEASIITLREMTGVFEKNAQQVPLVTDDTRWPRRHQTVTSAWEGENQTIPFDATLAFDQIALAPKLITSLVSISNQLSEDAIIPIADYVTGEIGWSQAWNIDQAAFLGDTTSTYGGFAGLTYLFNQNIPGTATANPGLYVGTTAGEKSDWTKITIEEVIACMAQLSAFEGTPGKMKIYASFNVIQSVFMRLKAKGGGNTVITLAQGAPGENLFSQDFLGYELVPTQVLPRTPSGSSEIIFFFGSLEDSSMFGTRKGLEIAQSREAGTSFQANQTWIRGLGRYAINNHDVGFTTLTPAGTNIAGPIVAFKTSAS